MKTLSLSGSSRENVGKRGASELRRQERVPAVLYGGEKQIHFSLINLKLILHWFRMDDALILAVEVLKIVYDILTKVILFFL